MRVLMLVGSYYPRSTGGIETFVQQLARRLCAEGHDVRLACPSDEPGASDAVADGTPVHHFHFPASLTREEYLVRRRPRGFDDFARWYDDLAPDIVHAHYLAPAAVLPPLEHARARGARTVLTAHYGAMTCMRASTLRFGTPMLRFGVEECDGEMRPARCSACTLQGRGVPRAAAWAIGATELLTTAVAPWLETRVGAAATLPAVVRRNRALLGRLYAALDWYVVAADWQRRALLANGLAPERIAQVRHGTALPAALLTRAPDAPTAFGWAARATPEKGLAELVDAFLALPDESGATLRIACVAGTPDEVAYRDALVRRTAANPRVCWGPTYDAATAGEFYSRIDVLVAPYAMETGPLTVIEALAHGVPVIGSDLGGIRELVADGRNGRLVGFRDFAGLARALREATAPGVVRAWQANAAWSRDYRHVAEDYLRLYSDDASAA